MFRAACAVLLAAPYLSEAFAPPRLDLLKPRHQAGAWVPGARTTRLSMSTAPDLSARGRALSEKLSSVSVYLVGMMGSGKSTVST
jgi:hypothetical protein